MRKIAPTFLTNFRRLCAALPLVVAGSLVACGGQPDSVDVPQVEFSALGVKGTVSGQTVSIDLSTLKECTDLNGLTIAVQASGYQISPDPSIRRDYRQPVQFVVTGPDGLALVYTVSVTGIPCPEPAPNSPPAIEACTAPALETSGYSAVFKACDSDNKPLFFDITECVRDNTTGLIWQGQTQPGDGLRATDALKTNFVNTTSEHRWNSTSLIFERPSQADVDATTNIIGFRNAINDSLLCGSSTWRIPSREELAGLVLSGSAPTIQSVWFPNTRSNVYWSSTQESGGTWVVDFSSGTTLFAWRDVVQNTPQSVRLVR